MFENSQGIDPMRPSEYFADYLKTVLQNHENVTVILKMRYKINQGTELMVFCAPWYKSVIHYQE